MCMDVALTRVEGEGEVRLEVSNGRVVNVSIKITEAPRFFEHIVRGRRVWDVPDIVSRICGLCGVSYVLVASKAFEKYGTLPEEVERYRACLHLAERIKSHAIHIFMLHLPDFLGLRSLTELTESYPHIVRDVIDVVLWSRRVMEVMGGRFHNVSSLKVGGVYQTPRAEVVKSLLNNINLLEGKILKLVETVLNLKNIPQEKQRIRYAVVTDGISYPHIGTMVAFDSGELVHVRDFKNMISVEQVNYSNALRYRLASGEPYLVGPLARFNMGYKYLSGEVKDLIESYGWRPPLLNIHQSIIARVAELYESFLKVKEFLMSYKEISQIINETEVPAGKYVAALEAPRGILYHEYEVTEEESVARVVKADIITPTAQNLAMMEKLILDEVSEKNLNVDKAVNVAKKIVRSFDPCISCSVHAFSLY